MIHDILLIVPDAESTGFKILLIASEILIPLIVFIGAYFIFKPVFEKQAKEAEEKKIAEDELKEKEKESDTDQPEKSSEMEG